MLDCGCPEHYPDWDNREISLAGQRIHTLSIPTPFHMPVAFPLYMQKQHDAVTQLELGEKWPGLVLVRTGFWRGSLIRLLEDTGSPTMSRHVGYLATPFNLYARLHHGNVSTLRPTLRKIQQSLLDQGRMPGELYLSHLTCPDCDSDRGGEKILVLRRWTDSNILKKKLRQRH